MTWFASTLEVVHPTVNQVRPWCQFLLSVSTVHKQVIKIANQKKIEVANQNYNNYIYLTISSQTRTLKLRYLTAYFYEKHFKRHCLGVRYRTPRLRGYGSGTGHRATPMRTVSGSGSLWNNFSARLGIRGCVSVPVRICSNCYFTNKNSCWSFTLLRPPSLIICIYCHTIQTSISLYKRY